MAISILPQHLNSYSLWLQKRQYQSNTIRNYLQDLKTFLTYSNFHISSEIIKNYIQEITGKNNSKRHLASLSSFCQFLLNQHITQSNLFRKGQRKVRQPQNDNINFLLIQYQEQLKKDNKSNLTIKNYLNDIHQYFDWLKQNEPQE